MKLKILSLNCWLLPPPFSSKNRKRIHQIIELIKEINPDIIALQEVWLNHYVNLIKGNLKEYYFFESNSKIFNRSGLLTGLKIKPKSFHPVFFPPLKNYNFIEGFCSKGYQIIKISKDTYFINTHLYSPLNREELKFNISQWKLLKGRMGRKNVILSGDLNLDEKDFSKEEYPFNYQNEDGLKKPENNKYTKMKLNRLYEYYDEEDYILKNFKKGSLGVRKLYSHVLSDHYPLLGKLEI